MVYHTVPNGAPRLLLFEDGLQIDIAGGTVESVNGLANIWKERSRTLSPGDHTYEVKLGQATATATAHALGNGLFPLVLMVVEG